MTGDRAGAEPRAGFGKKHLLFRQSPSRNLRAACVLRDPRRRPQLTVQERQRVVWPHRRGSGDGSGPPDASTACFGPCSSPLPPAASLWSTCTVNRPRKAVLAADRSAENREGKSQGWRWSPSPGAASSPRLSLQQSEWPLPSVGSSLRETNTFSEV